MPGRRPIALSVVIAASLFAMTSGTAAAGTVPEVVAGQVIVRHEGDAQPEIVRTGNVDQTIARLDRSGDVVYAEPVYRTQAASIPANPAFGEQWHLGDATQISRSWNLAGGGAASVIVGNVDSGVNLTHPALAGATLWTNAGEIAGNGVDDDDDGCVDDVHGCDMVDHDGDPSDANGHGTATAGVISAGWGASIEDAGVAPSSTLIVGRALDAKGAGTTAQLAAALQHVADHGARVVNVSVTGPDSAAVDDVIATHPNTLFVAAAGNAGADADLSTTAYPCASDAPNVICVGASDQSGDLASFSNFGAHAVDLVAPGVEIATLTLSGYSDDHSGTSFSAPIVAGVAALGFAAAPTATVADVRAAILSSVDPLAALAGRTATGGKLNAYAALHALTGRSDDAPASNPAEPASPTAHAAPLTVAPRPATGTLAVAAKAKRRGSKALVVTLRCRGTARCAGKLVAAGQKTPTSFSLDAGARRKVTLAAKLTRKTRAVALVATVAGTSLRLRVKVAANGYR